MNGFYLALVLHPRHHASQLSIWCGCSLSNLCAVMLLVRFPFLISNSNRQPQLQHVLVSRFINHS